MAKLYFNYATMNAGKTTMLLQASYNYRERGMRRCCSSPATTEGRHRAASRRASGWKRRPRCSVTATISTPASTEHHEHTTVHCVFVDEAQFLEEEQVWQLARIADRLTSRSCATACAPISRASCSPARARCWRSPTSCAKCAPSAIAAARRRWSCGSARTARWPGKASRSAIGKDVYVSLCRRHWEEEMGRAAPDDFIGFTKA